MSLKKFWSIALILSALLCFFPLAVQSEEGSAADDRATGGSAVTVDMSGWIKATQYNPQKYPFTLNNSATLDSALLDKAADGGLSGEDFTNLFKTLFGKELENGGSVPVVTGELKGTTEGDKVTLSGKITVAWTAGGGKGNKSLSCNLEGSMNADGSDFTLNGKNYDVKGSWNWGGGSMAMIGEGTLSIK